MKLDGEPSVRHAAEVLAVDHVLTGTIRSSGSTHVVTLQLVRNDDMITWTRRYDFAAGNLLSLPDTIAEEVVGALASNSRPPSVNGCASAARQRADPANCTCAAAPLSSNIRKQG